jgi:hypothetical protein
MMRDLMREAMGPQAGREAAGERRRDADDAFSMRCTGPGVEMAGGSWVEWFYGTDCCDRMDGCESCRWGPKLGRLEQLASDGRHATAGQV